MAEPAYIVDDNVPPAIREDIAWLYKQPEGRSLFDQAFHIHKKPLRFSYSETIPCSYTDIGDAHTVTINPAIGSEHYFDVHEKPQPFTMRQILGHEVAHAGQEGLAHQGEEQIMERIQQEAFRIMGKNQAVYTEAVDVMEQARNAGSRQEAKAILTRYLDKTYSAATAQNIISVMRENREYAQLIDEFEAPAIQAENTILKILGKPERHSDYLINFKHQFTHMKEGVLAMQLGLLEEDSAWKNIAEAVAPTARTIAHADVQPAEASVAKAGEEAATIAERSFVDRLFKDAEGSLHKGKLAGAAAIVLAGGGWAAYELLKRNKQPATDKSQQNLR